MKPYFSHDEGARNDPKLVKVLMRLGQAGKGVYWDLVEMLYEQDGYLPLAEIESYAFALRTEPALIISLINDFGLFEKDDEAFWSESALVRMSMRVTKSEKRAAAGSKGGKARAERAAAKALLKQSLNGSQAMLENSQALLEANEAELEANEAELEDFQAIKGKEIKGKEKKENAPSTLRSEGGTATAAASAKKLKTMGSTDPADYTLPSWATEKFAEAFGKWLVYRQSHRKGKLLRGSIEMVLTELAGYNEVFCLQLFGHAIKNGNQGLTFDDTPAKFAASQQPGTTRGGNGNQQQVHRPKYELIK